MWYLEGSGAIESLNTKYKIQRNVWVERWPFEVNVKEWDRCGSLLHFFSQCFQDTLMEFNEQVWLINWQDIINIHQCEIKYINLCNDFSLISLHKVCLTGAKERSTRRRPWFVSNGIPMFCWGISPSNLTNIL